MLRFVLRDVARAAIIATLVGASATACGGDDGIDRDGFESSSFCGTAQSKLDALRVALGAEWVGIVTGGKVTEESGVSCTDAACNAAIAATDGGSLNPGQAGGVSMMVEKGGELRIAKSAAEMGVALGPIDSAEKVYWVMWANGYGVDCNEWVKKTGGGFEAIGTIMTKDCDPIVKEEHRVSVGVDGKIAVLERVEKERQDGVCVGRRPAGLVSRAPNDDDGSGRGGWFARAAQLEAASVDAFRILARELTVFGAPAALVAEAERSARDEIRHAAMMSRVAKRFGARVEAPVVEARADRSLFDVARENAIEGCVRETYGAVEALVLADLESDPEIAKVLHAIARDEARHAELAWSVAAWARTKLTAAEIADVEQAMRDAAADLERELPASGAPAHALRLLGERVWADRPPPS